MSNVDRFVLAMAITVFAYAHTFWLLICNAELSNALDGNNAAVEEYTTFQRGLVSTYFFVVSDKLAINDQDTRAIFINHYECFRIDK